MSWYHVEDSNPSARKEYQCLLCCEKILVAEKHVKRSGYDDNGMTSFRMHVECASETKGWDDMDWETFEDFERPKAKRDWREDK